MTSVPQVLYPISEKIQLFTLLAPLILDLASPFAWSSKNPTQNPTITDHLARPPNIHTNLS